MTDAEESAAMVEICSLLPQGYLKQVPFSTANEVSFPFNGKLLQMSAVYLNEQFNCYMFDLAWDSENKVCGIPIRAGIDIVKQFKSPLPNMFAYNTRTPGAEIDSHKFLFMFVLDETVLNANL